MIITQYFIISLIPFFWYSDANTNIQAGGIQINSPQINVQYNHQTNEQIETNINDRVRYKRISSLVKSTNKLANYYDELWETFRGVGGNGITLELREIYKSLIVVNTISDEYVDQYILRLEKFIGDIHDPYSYSYIKIDPYRYFRSPPSETGEISNLLRKYILDKLSNILNANNVVKCNKKTQILINNNPLVFIEVCMINDAHYSGKIWYDDEWIFNF